MRSLLVALLVTGACARIDVQATTGAPKGTPPIRRLAIVTFASLASAPQAGPALTAALVSELRRRGGVEIVEASGAARAQAERWRATELGKSLGVDAVLVGEVLAYEYGPGAQPGTSTVTPSLGVTVRLIASASGNVIWAATLDAERQQVGSYGGVSLLNLAQDVADELAALLGRAVAG
jgi:TolB-like protein